MADDIEAHNAGVTDGRLPSLGDDEWLEEEETSGKEAWKQVKVLAIVRVVRQQSKRLTKTGLFESGSAWVQ
jgi:hypothetical protein